MKHVKDEKNIMSEDHTSVITRKQTLAEGDKSDSLNIFPSTWVIREKKADLKTSNEILYRTEQNFYSRKNKIQKIPIKNQVIMPLSIMNQKFLFHYQKK